MARTNNLTNFLSDVADAIREKKGTSEAIQASDFDTEIANLPSGGGLDWSAIGYSEEPESIEEDYNYAKDIYDNWDSTQTNLQSKFVEDYKLRIMPLVNTSVATNTSYMFQACYSLKEVPLLDISNSTTTLRMFQNCYALETAPNLDYSQATTVREMFSNCFNLKNVPVLNIKKPSSSTSMNNVFLNCFSLTNTSLDNILQMCIGLTSYGGTKTLKQMGIASTYATRIQALPHYQDFLDAGWTIGY